MNDSHSALKVSETAAGAPSGNRARLHGRVAVLKHVVTPLVQAMSDVKNANKGQPAPQPEEEARTLSDLVDGAVALASSATSAFNENKDPLDDNVRWMIIHAATQNIAARYRATGHVMTG